METKLELVHLQITKNCNLRCWFCGQWGKKGFFADSCAEAMTLEDWRSVIRQLVAYREETGHCLDVILWGGEPLLCPYFEELVLDLRSQGFRLGLVTNGTLIHRHAQLLKQEFSHIYVSVDGDRDLHDRIRGAGVFDKVAANLELLRGGNPKISIMSVITQESLPGLAALPEVLCNLSCDEVLLQEMIYLTAQEAADYARWLKEEFGREAAEIFSWVGSAVDPVQKQAALAQIKARAWPKPVCYLPHGQRQSHCLSPFRHAHIAWNGNVLYCTDFYDFSAGNVKQEKLLDIFENEATRHYREEIQKGRCAACSHCSWKNSEDFGL